MSTVTSKITGPSLFTMKECSPLKSYTDDISVSVYIPLQWL